MAKKSPTRKAARTRRATSVPDTYRGFSLQATRFLYYLLTAEQDDIVSLEYFEDVGVEKVDGTRIAEQDKSYRSSNPLSDRSVVLWKTLRNWVDAATEGTLPPDKSTFVVYAPQASMGDVVNSFHVARTLEEAKSALKKAQALLTSKEDGWDIGESAVEHVDVFFTADCNLTASILVRFTTDTTNERPEEVLKPILLEKLVGPDSFDIVIRQAHGWVKQQIDRFVGLGKPVRILKRDFHEPLLTFVRTHDRICILRSVAGSPSEEDVQSELAFRQYVQQLRIVDLDDVDVLQAVNDYLSASIDRTTWSDLGMISESSLQTLESELTTTWRNKRRRVRAAYTDKDGVSQGQLLFSDCMEHDTRVDDLETPRQFIRGSWHALADDHAVGWHPDYASELKRRDKVERREENEKKQP
jgi:hypothetical protein